MLDIRVLGTGCVGCLKTEQMVIEALGALGVRDAKVELEAALGFRDAALHFHTR